MKKKLTAILLAVFLVTGLAGCGSKVPAGTVATVNGVAISQEELDANFNQFMQMYETYGVDTSDETLQINLRNSLLESLIVQELIVQEAENREITVSDEDVNAYIQSVKDSYGDADAYVKVLEENGYTEASYAEAVREQMVIELFRDDLVNHPEVVDVAKARHIL